jgi:hypothetical protein
LLFWAKINVIPCDKLTPLLVSWIKKKITVDMRMSFHWYCFVCFWSRDSALPTWFKFYITRELNVLSIKCLNFFRSRDIHCLRLKRREHFRVYMCAMFKFLFHFIFFIQVHAMYELFIT